MKLKTLLFFTAIFFFSIKCFGQANDEQILFIKFQYLKGEIKIVEMTAVPGKLKRPKINNVNNDGLMFNVLSKENKTIYSDYSENPSVTSYEYFSESGEIKRTEVANDSSCFVIRAPYNESINKIVFHKNINNKILLKNSAGAPSDKLEFDIIHSLIKKK